MIRVKPHPGLDLRAFITEFPTPLGNLTSSDELLALLRQAGDAPMQSSDEVRAAVRDVLRHGGFKPTGRSKPASEYLLRTAQERGVSTINVAVDCCNAVSLHSGLPISVVDVDRAKPPFYVEIAAVGSSYVFNPTGQVIDIGGLVCLFDADGPCANAVKDAQRTKTDETTKTTLSLIWGATTLKSRTLEAEGWYHHILQDHGAKVRAVYP